MHIDRDELERRIAQLNQLMLTHAGGLQLEAVDGAGVVRVRFNGMCLGCESRPVTFAATVRPVLAAIPGVTAVQLAGGRISAEAEARLLASLAAEDGICRVVWQARSLPMNSDTLGNLK